MHNQDNFMISLQLVKGTTLVFLDFAHEFFNVINQTIDHQSQQLRVQMRMMRGIPDSNLPMLRDNSQSDSSQERERNNRAIQISKQFDLALIR